MRKERVKIKLNNYDEKIDTLIRSALQEKAGDYKVSDEVKKRIDQRLKESKMLASSNFTPEQFLK